MRRALRQARTQRPSPLRQPSSSLPDCGPASSDVEEPQRHRSSSGHGRPSVRWDYTRKIMFASAAHREPAVPRLRHGSAAKRRRFSRCEWSLPKLDGLPVRPGLSEQLERFFWPPIRQGSGHHSNRTDQRAHDCWLDAPPCPASNFWVIAVEIASVAIPTPKHDRINRLKDQEQNRNVWRVRPEGVHIHRPLVPRT